jgi:feruloyl esterase
VLFEDNQQGVVFPGIKLTLPAEACLSGQACLRRACADKNQGDKMKMRPSCIAVTGVLLTLAACGGSSNDGNNGATAAVTRVESDRCAVLAQSALPESSTVITATYNAGSVTIGSTSVTVPFCRVVAASRPTADSSIGFEVWMPPAGSWNGKFQGVGSGSSAGSIGVAAMLVALRDGYAVMATDNGHVTDASRPNGAAEQTWALGHPEKVVDFAYRAQHVSTAPPRS